MGLLIVSLGGWETQIPDTRLRNSIILRKPFRRKTSRFQCRRNDHGRQLPWNSTRQPSVTANASAPRGYVRTATACQVEHRQPLRSVQPGRPGITQGRYISGVVYTVHRTPPDAAGSRRKADAHLAHRLQNCASVDKQSGQSLLFDRYLLSHLYDHHLRRRQNSWSQIAGDPPRLDNHEPFAHYPVMMLTYMRGITISTEEQFPSGDFLSSVC
ncbi:hypothetical protein FDG2_0836 [Candidatus Protofrankia californiensis]|uniref:Uncharacterized protein n=1 Tax=Candidatus Protofrankia californiensis TaxID=1839754 RepID=A0A1C3NUD9_9ACTN|nr:hypothetical protein FDG2_0836 [Candidatus Protofrankia californiensis]